LGFHFKYDVYVVTVVQALDVLLGDPVTEGGGLRRDLANEYINDHNSFMSKAEEHTRKNAEKRP